MQPESQVSKEAQKKMGDNTTCWRMVENQMSRIRDAIGSRSHCEQTSFNRIQTCDVPSFCLPIEAQQLGLVGRIPRAQCGTGVVGPPYHRESADRRARFSTTHCKVVLMGRLPISTSLLLFENSNSQMPN